MPQMHLSAVETLHLVAEFVQQVMSEHGGARSESHSVVERVGNWREAFLLFFPSLEGLRTIQKDHISCHCFRLAPNCLHCLYSAKLQVQEQFCRTV